MITPIEARELSEHKYEAGRSPILAIALRDLASQVEALQADAARYRWLRSGKCSFDFARRVLNDTPFGIDAAIDKAMEGK